MQINQSSRGKQLILTALAVVSIPLAFAYTQYEVENRPLPEAKSEAQAPVEVSVTELTVRDHSTTILAHGEVKPQYELVLTAQVEGQVTKLSPQLSEGSLVAKAHSLVIIDAVNYLQQLASAEQQVESANLALMLERRESTNARSEWQRAAIPNETASSLVLREPQLAVARAQVVLAHATLTKAKKDFANTQISAPFDAIVVDRHVSLGQYVRVGDKIATLYSTERFDIEVAIPQQQWPLLAERQQLMGSDQINLSDEQGNQWQGKVTQVEQHIDKSNRQRSLVVSVFAPLEQSQPLYAGSFLTVAIKGVVHKDLLSVPANSLTRSGFIWYTDDNNTLQKFKPTIVFQKDGLVYVKPHQGSTRLSVVNHPLQTHIEGQQVVVKSNQLKPMFASRSNSAED